MAEHAIDVEGLVREYKKGPRAVDGVDLYVERGEIYGFLGPNGAGKSTMVKMLVTLLPPSGGRATVGGFDIATQGDQVRRVIGVALQEAALDPLLTGREHLYLQAGLNGFGKKEAKERGETLLERVGLSGAGRPEDRRRTRAGCAGGSISRSRSSTRPASSSSTSRRPGSTRTAGTRCGKKSGGWRATRA